VGSWSLCPRGHGLQLAWFALPQSCHQARSSLPGGTYSDERATWVRARVQEELAGAPLGDLRRKLVRLLNVLRQGDA
jgi:hypothetical protein